jgi:hypothetical protein
MDAGTYYPEQPLFSVKTLPLSLLILAEWEIT